MLNLKNKWKINANVVVNKRMSRLNKTNVKVEKRMLKLKKEFQDQIKRMTKLKNECHIKKRMIDWILIRKTRHTRQGLAFQGDTDDESNFIQLLRLKAKDEPLLIKWLERKDDKYTSHEIQNEIISIMANNVIRDLTLDIRGGFFSIISDWWIYRYL